MMMFAVLSLTLVALTGGATSSHLQIAKDGRSARADQSHEATFTAAVRAAARDGEIRLSDRQSGVITVTLRGFGRAEPTLSITVSSATESSCDVNVKPHGFQVGFGGDRRAIKRFWSNLEAELTSADK